MVDACSCALWMLPIDQRCVVMDSKQNLVVKIKSKHMGFIHANSIAVGATSLARLVESI
jgi:hypothetical protein